MMPHMWHNILMNRMIPVFCSSSVRPVISTPVQLLHDLGTDFTVHYFVNTKCSL